MNTTMERRTCTASAAAIASMLVLMVIVGCAAPAPHALPTTPPTTPASPTADCTTKDCFIAAANDCNDITLTLTEDAGTFTYATNGCVFTKTLVSTNVNETQEMKTLLQGKSLTCKYEQGKFDRRWVTSLVFGTEYCEGKLKDILGQLIAFG